MKISTKKIHSDWKIGEIIESRKNPYEQYQIVDCNKNGYSPTEVTLEKLDEEERLKSEFVVSRFTP